MLLRLFNATSFVWIVINIFLDQANLHLYTLHGINHTTSTPGYTSRHIFEIKWSDPINYGQFSNFLPKSAPCDVILGQPGTSAMYKEERLCQTLPHIHDTPLWSSTY